MFHDDPVTAAVFPIASFVFKAGQSYHISFVACFFTKLLCHIHLQNLFFLFFPRLDNSRYAV